METNTLTLKWYEKVNVVTYKKLGLTVKRSRVYSIDWFKGYSIMWVTFSHLLAEWLAPNAIWEWRFLFLFLEILGPTTFLFFAGMNMAMNYRYAQERSVPHKVILIDTIRKMSGMLLLAIMENILLGSGAGYYISDINFYFRWDILQTIAFSVILCVPLMKLSVMKRFMISWIIFIFSYPIYQILDAGGNNPISLLFQILFFNPILRCPLFPTIGYAVVGTIILDLFYPYIKLKNKSAKGTISVPTKIDELGIPFRSVTIISFIITLASFLFGFGATTDPIFVGQELLILQDLYTNPFLASYVQYIPVVFLVYQPINMIYKICFVTFAFCILFYYFDIKKPKSYKPSYFSQLMLFFGEYSFSYFIFAGLFVIIPFAVDEITVWILMIALLFGITYFFRFLLLKFYGTGMIEWIMILFTIDWDRKPSVEEIRAAYPEKFLKEGLSIAEKPTEDISSKAS